ncbi:S100P-binding protein [Halichoeres trimaculatus]|uniref:S100P-binding protein n=1 Tax=Halichoeres trimaculatus TaxID=147232 RepID=UPI003D9FA7E1
MDEKDKQKNTVFNRLHPMTFEHFKPISKYSMFIKCEQKTDLHQAGMLPNQFVNFKIEVLNKCQKKRKSDDTASHHGYETPAKKVFIPNALSPDLGCVMDFSSPTAGQDSVSPLASSKLSLLDSSQTVSSGIKGHITSEQESQQVKFGILVDQADIKETSPHSLKSEEVHTDRAPDFDCDVDDILCLNPAGAPTGVEFTKNVESCKFPSENILKPNPVNPSVAQRQKLEKGHWQVDEKKEEQRQETGKDKEEEDKGYFSASYLKDLELGKNLSPSGYSQPHFVASSPQLGLVKAPEDESRPESSKKQNSFTQAKLSVKDVSLTDRGLCPIVSGSQFGSLRFPEELLEGGVGEVWNIGQPIFESSLCQEISVKLESDGEKVSEKLEGNVTEPIHECQATLGSEETTLETSYDSTISFVKVKSVVVAPSHSTFSSRLSSELNAYSSELSQNRNRGFQPSRGPRPAIFKTKADLEHEKQLYIHLVTGHMNERPPADPVTELQSLMTHVADQTTDQCAEQWQHPSDLTRRNYKNRFGSVKPNMSLAEWQAKNRTTHKRFGRIPKNSERSHSAFLLR